VGPQNKKYAHCNDHYRPEIRRQPHPGHKFINEEKAADTHQDDPATIPETMLNPAV